jgi:SAM-dependent methyltransferase
VNYVAGNLYELPFPEASFDVVVSQEVIAHVSDPQDFLKRISEFLKPDGHLIITTANRVVIERTDLPPDPREHIKEWLDRRAFRRILSENFSVLSMTSIIPMGNRGFLRVVNSPKLNSVLGAVFAPKTLQDWKERAGLGYSLVALARKKSL